MDKNNSVNQGQDTSNLETKTKITSPSNYNQIERLSIYTVTWNLHGKKAKIDELRILIPKNLFHHIYIIGTEECMRSIFTSLIYSDKSEWENLIQSYLGAEYILIQAQNLSAIHLIAFAHKSIYSQISNINSTYIKNGFFGTLGNKGAVAISFNLFRKSVLLINSHLAAGQNYTSKRNDDFLRINSSLQLNGNNDSNEDKYRTISDRFDICIWLGDFNYRINLNLSQIKNYFSSLENVIQSIPELLKYDQMKIEKENGNLFINNFIEADIIFAPTYKLIEGSHDYVIEEGGDRIPGWTDRIIYKSKDPYTVRLKEYNSIPEIIFSDHKPVFAVFQFELLNSKPLKKEIQDT